MATRCSGVVYGVCLGALVWYLKLDKVTTAFTVRQIEARLVPVAQAALKTRGVDARILAAGIASSRVLKAQIALLGADAAPPPLHSRNGHSTTSIGTTAAIYVVFCVLCSDMLGSVDAKRLESDVQWMLDEHSIERVLDVAIEFAANSLPLEGVSCALPFELAAIDAEHRALQRARCAVDVARCFCDRQSFSPMASFRTILSWFERGAWPIGELLNERTHEDLLRRLKVDAFYLTAPVEPRDVPPFEHVPLSQLSAVDRIGRCGDSDASSIATGSSATRWSSNASYSDAGDDGGVCFTTLGIT